MAGEGSSLLLARKQGVGYSFDYFIDSVNGNDANSGLSPGNAFATGAPWNALSSISGKLRLGLAKGSLWDGTNGNPLISRTEDGISIGAYGTGAAPLGDCSALLNNASWTLTSGQTQNLSADRGDGDCRR